MYKHLCVSKAGTRTIPGSWGDRVCGGFIAARNCYAKRAFVDYCQL